MKRGAGDGSFVKEQQSGAAILLVVRSAASTEPGLSARSLRILRKAGLVAVSALLAAQIHA